MRGRTPEQRAADRAAAVELVEAACADCRVYPGESGYNMASWYKDVRDLRHHAYRVERQRDRDRDVPLPRWARWGNGMNDKLGDDLAWAAAQGLIGVIPLQYRRGNRYASIGYHLARLAELDLADAVRAERTTARIAEQYAERVANYGDRVNLWPVTNVQLSDGIEPAVDAGLIRRVADRHATGGSGYVPADRWDAYVDALERYEAAQARAAALHAGLADELAARGYPGDAGRLDTEVLRWLLDRLPAPVASLHE